MKKKPEKGRKPNGQFDKGNEFSPGTQKKFTPEELKVKSEAYFRYCDENPLQVAEMVRGGDMAGAIIHVPRARPYTFEGLCDFIRITPRNLMEYEKDPRYQHIYTHVRNKIRMNQLEGATANIYNASIVARMNNLVDSKKVEHEGELKVKQITGMEIK